MQVIYIGTCESSFWQGKSDLSLNSISCPKKQPSCKKGEAKNAQVTDFGTYDIKTWPRKLFDTCILVFCLLS